MITLSIAGHVATVALDRPASRNALNLEGWRALAAAIGEVAASNARVVVLASTDARCFCAGSDLADLAGLAADPSGREPFRRAMRDALDPLRGLSIPTLAAIDGDCFGAGVALAVACDIRLAGEAARFGITPAKLGISYPKEDIDRVVETVGRAQAARLCFAAETIDAAEAVRIGLAQQLAPSALAQAQALALAIAGNAPQSVAALKATISASPGSGLATFDQQFDGLFGKPAFREGLEAFGARRPPRF